MLLKNGANKDMQNNKVGRAGLASPSTRQPRAPDVNPWALTPNLGSPREEPRAWCPCIARSSAHVRGLQTAPSKRAQLGSAHGSAVAILHQHERPRTLCARRSPGREG